jgi:hypothetical protein
VPLSWSQQASLLGPPGPIAPLTIWIPSPQSEGRRILLRAPHALTISRLDAVLTGGNSPSVSVVLGHGADASAAGTTVTTDPIAITSTSTGTAITSLLNPQVAEGHWLWLEITAASGSPAALTVSVALQ